MRKLKFYIIIPVILISLGILTAFVISGNNKSENKNKKNMEHLTAQTFKEKVFNYETNKEWKYAGTQPCIIDFYADWCGPCKMVSPLVDELSEESDAYKVGKVNVDESPELAAKYGVMSIPTLIVLKDGKVAQQAIGARGKDAIRKMLA